MNKRELSLMAEFFGTFRHPRVRLFRRNIINKTVQDIHSPRIFQVKAGLTGQADCYAFVRSQMPVYGNGGMHIGWTANQGPSIPVEIEFKGARTPTSDEQINWRRFCIEWGIPHIILKAERDEEPADTIKRWVFELNTFINRL